MAQKLKLLIERNKDRIYEIVLIIAFIQIPFLALSKMKPKGVFYSNQTLYYLHGMRSAGVEYLQIDPDAMVRSTHWLFSQLVYILETLNITAKGSQVLQAFLIGVFSFSFLPIAYSLYKSWQSEGNFLAQGNAKPIEFSITSLVIFTVLMFRNHYMFPEGLGNMSILTDYLQPSNFAIFIVLGIGLALIDRWWLATIALIISSTMHSNFLFIASIVILVMAFELYKKDRWKLAASILVTFGLINLPFFILGPVQWSQLNGDEGIYILNNIRSPHHYVVSEWWDSRDTIILVNMALGMTLVWVKSSRLLRNIMAALLSYSIFGVLVEVLTGSTVVASLLPWRASSILLPISQMILIVAIVSFPIKYLGSKGVVGVVLAFSLFWNITQSPFQWPDANHSYSNPEIRLLHETTIESDLILVPPTFPGEFRLYAERPIYVLMKSTGYDVNEWFKRVQFAEEFLSSNEQVRQVKCHENNIDYYMFPVELLEPNIAIVGKTKDYALLECD